MIPVGVDCQMMVPVGEARGKKQSLRLSQTRRS